MIKVLVPFVLAMSLGSLPTAASSSSSNLPEALHTIRAVGAEGQGNAEASQAWRQVAAAAGEQLPIILGGMDGAGDVTINWLRSAVEVIVDRELSAQGSLPVAALGEFLLDTSHHPRARRLAFDLLSRVQPEAAQTLLPGMLNDPSVDLRRDAVQRLLDQGRDWSGAQNQAAAALVYRQALGFARDVHQIQEISEALKKLGQPVNLPRHFGFLMDWKVIGPFHNEDRQGFDTKFPPETEINLQTEYPGKSGTVRWQDYVTTHDYGLVDINKPCGALKEVTAYAYTEFVSDGTRPAELRLGCKNGWKIWFNGQLLFGRDEYHRNMQIDQYRLPIQLQTGRNTILVKICQNEQVEEWTKEWEFQLRVCDPIGTAILASDRP